MSLVVFNTHMNIYDLERFKELPYELQDMIAHYSHEGYNLKWSNYNWYRIINDIGSNRGWDFIIDLLNHFISSKKSVCRNKNMIGHCKINTCQEFITCHDKLSIGWQKTTPKSIPP